jgi:FAD/FMN-containing dehydrogenase
MPAVGTITIGGALAIDAHGSALPALGETLPPGQTLGSLSNRILALTAVVWDAAQSAYALRSFTRLDTEAGALMTHLGRAFITEVTLRAGANQRMRCQSYTDITADELFAAPGSSGRTMAQFIDSAGRVEAIWFPFTSTPWLKVWSLAPQQPLLSREVLTPYNYPFSDIIPEPVAVLAERIIAGNPEAAPLLGAAQYAVSAAGLVATLSQDIWGWSKDVLLYILPSTLRLTENGHAILTSRSQIQRVINEFTTQFSAQLAAYQAQGKYPVNGAVEIRASGLDHPADSGVPGAGAPYISALRPRTDHPEWDCVVWLNCLSIPGTPYLNDFNRELEQWLYQNYSGNYAAVRPEWSKGWAYGASVGWSDPTMLGSTIPDGYRAGQPAGADWDAAVALLDQMDPHGVFSAPLLERLLP